MNDWTNIIDDRPSADLRRALYRFGVARKTVAILSAAQAQTMLREMIAADQVRRHRANLPCPPAPVQEDTEGPSSSCSSVRN
jgi:hypothetical protein